MDNRHFFLGIDEWQKYPQVMYSFRKINDIQAAEVMAELLKYRYYVIAMRRHPDSVEYELSRKLYEGGFNYSFIFYHQNFNKDGSLTIFIRIYNIVDNNMDPDEWEELIDPRNMNPLATATMNVPVSFDDIVWK